MTQDISGVEDEDVEVESHFPTVTLFEVKETVVDLPTEQEKSVAHLRHYGPSAKIDTKNTYDYYEFLLSSLPYFFNYCGRCS